MMAHKRLAARLATRLCQKDESERKANTDPAYQLSAVEGKPRLTNRLERTGSTLLDCAECSGAGRSAGALGEQPTRLRI